MWISSVLSSWPVIFSALLITETDCALLEAGIWNLRFSVGADGGGGGTGAAEAGAGAGATGLGGIGAATAAGAAGLAAGAGSGALSLRENNMLMAGSPGVVQVFRRNSWAATACGRRCAPRVLPRRCDGISGR